MRDLPIVRQLITGVGNPNNGNFGFQFCFGEMREGEKENLCHFCFLGKGGLIGVFAFVFITQLS